MFISPDVPAEKPDPSHPDYNATYVEATKGKKLPPAGEQMEAIEDKSLSMVIIGGLSGLLILLVIIIVIIVVVRRRNRNHIPDHKFYNGGPAHSMSNGDTVCVQGKEVDNIQLQIHRSPQPSDVPHKSPVESRKHQVKMTAAQSPLLDPRKVAWDQMLIRQAMEDNDQEMQEEELLNHHHHPHHHQQEQQQPHHEQHHHSQQPLPPPPQEELPPPPAFLLQNDEEPQLNQGDNGSYHAVLDGYHSEDNVDDIDVDEPFQVQMPRNMYGQIS